MNPQELPPHARLMQYIVGKWISKPVYAAAELGIADILAEGPKSIEELAERSGTHPAPLYRMMRALASVGIAADMRGREGQAHAAIGIKGAPPGSAMEVAGGPSAYLRLGRNPDDRTLGAAIDWIRLTPAEWNQAYGGLVWKWKRSKPGVASSSWSATMTLAGLSPSTANSLPSR